MVADLDHYYVPKEHVDYVLWNLLTGVGTPARLDRPDRPDTSAGSANEDASGPANAPNA
jgi:hypothetical protein